MDMQNHMEVIRVLEIEIEQLKKEILKLQEMLENQRHQLFRMSFK